MVTRKLRIAFLGVTGFPYKIGAEIKRIHLIARGLAENNCQIIVINRKCFVHSEKIPKIGHISMIRNVFAAGRPKKRANRLIKGCLIIKGTLIELYLLRRFRIDAAIISSRSFWLILHYKIWSAILGFKIILNYTELNSSLRNRKKNPLKHVNDILFEKYMFRLLDGVLPISELLRQTVLRQNKGIPILKVPVLADFSAFYKTSEINERYFIYCGQASYQYLIEFILQAFNYINDSSVRLKLVIYGYGKDLEKVKVLISNSEKLHCIDMYSELNYNELVNLYMNATGLLIPLKFILKDEARFPHKVGEYTAAGRPIITTNYGEIKYFFTDMKNALVAESFDPCLYADKMLFALDNPEITKQIGDNAKLTGLNNFDYRVQGILVSKFIKEMIS